MVLLQYLFLFFSVDIHISVLSHFIASLRVFRKKRGRRHSGASTVSNMSSVSFADDIEQRLPPHNWRGRNTCKEINSPEDTPAEMT